MSDTFLQYVPADPAWRPSAEAAERARARLAEWLPEAERIEFAFKDEVEFFAPGENWAGVACPACGADIEDWWSEAMDAAHEDAFADLSVTPPCCGGSTSLNDLGYTEPAAFGSFVLEAMNPRVSGAGPERDAAVADALGAAVRTVWVLA